MVLLFSCQPPPVYDASHYVRPGLQSTLTTFMSNRNRVVQPNYSTVTEVTTMTTSEVGIRRDNLQNTLQYQMIYTNCRSHSTSTTVYKGPRMTTALNGIVPNHEEIAKRDWPSLLSTVRTPIRPRPPEMVSYYFNSRLHTRTHYEFVLQQNQHRPPRWISNAYSYAVQTSARPYAWHINYIIGFYHWLVLLNMYMTCNLAISIITTYYNRCLYYNYSYPARRCLGQRFVFLIKIFVDKCICCLFILTNGNHLPNAKKQKKNSTEMNNGPVTNWIWVYYNT